RARSSRRRGTADGRSDTSSSSSICTPRVSRTFEAQSDFVGKSKEVSAARCVASLHRGPGLFEQIANLGMDGVALSNDERLADALNDPLPAVFLPRFGRNHQRDRNMQVVD